MAKKKAASKKKPATPPVAGSPRKRARPAKKVSKPKYELKTQPTDDEVNDFIGRVFDPTRRADCATLLELMQHATGQSPKMWGPSIVGFGQYHYRYESGHEGDMCAVGFSPRQKALTIYGLEEVAADPALQASLGKVTAGKGCLYVKRLADVNTEALQAAIKRAYRAKQ